MSQSDHSPQQQAVPRSWAHGCASQAEVHVMTQNYRNLGPQRCLTKERVQVDILWFDWKQSSPTGMSGFFPFAVTLWWSCHLDIFAANNSCGQKCLSINFEWAHQPNNKHAFTGFSKMSSTWLKFPSVKSQRVTTNTCTALQTTQDFTCFVSQWNHGPSCQRSSPGSSRCLKHAIQRFSGTELCFCNICLVSGGDLLNKVSHDKGNLPTIHSPPETRETVHCSCQFLPGHSIRMLSLIGHCHCTRILEIPHNFIFPSTFGWKRVPKITCQCFMWTGANTSRRLWLQSFSSKLSKNPMNVS